MTKKCVFCDIIQGNTDTEVIYQDDSYIAFPDIRPASMHHYLIVTKEHIPSAKDLQPHQINIVEDLERIGKQVLEMHSGDPSDIKQGFHWPPFHSVAHLHLHIISPKAPMSWLSRMIFRDSSPWFVTPEYVKERLRNQAAEK